MKHPTKGFSIAVEPIRKPAHIDAIRRLLAIRVAASRPRPPKADLSRL